MNNNKIYIVSKYFDKNSNTYNISINDCLKPKEIEKKTYGEVFIPNA